jgi:hypothetical protein
VQLRAMMAVEVGEPIFLPALWDHENACRMESRFRSGNSSESEKQQEHTNSAMTTPQLHGNASITDPNKKWKSALGPP